MKTIYIAFLSSLRSSASSIQQELIDECLYEVRNSEDFLLTDCSGAIEQQIDWLGECALSFGVPFYSRLRGLWIDPELEDLKYFDKSKGEACVDLMKKLEGFFKTPEYKEIMKKEKINEHSNFSNLEDLPF